MHTEESLTPSIIFVFFLEVGKGCQLLLSRIWRIQIEKIKDLTQSRDTREKHLYQQTAQRYNQNIDNAIIADRLMSRSITKAISQNLREKSRTCICSNIETILS